MTCALTTETPDRFNGKIKQILVSLQLMLLLAAVEQTIISTAMPKIIDALGGFKLYAWATTSYLLSSTITIPVIGRLSDIYGRRLLLAAGVVVFVAASVLCGLAGIGTVAGAAIAQSQSWFDPMQQFILARGLQGLGGGVVIGLTFTVVGDLFSPAARGKYQGHFAAVFALSSVVGPTLGGWVAEHYSWRWLFFATVPIGAAAIYLFLRSFPSDRAAGEPAVNAPTKPSVDCLGIAVFTVSMLVLLLTLTELSSFIVRFLKDQNYSSLSWDSPLTISSLTLALALVAFVDVERRVKEPFMRLAYFKNSIINISCFSVFVTGMGMFGGAMVLPIFFQTVLGYSASVSGFMLSPLIVCVALASIVGGAIMSSSKRYKLLLLIGLGFMAVGTILLAGQQSRISFIYALCCMLLSGFGLGLILPVYTVVIQNSVSQEEIGAVTGFSQFFRSVGGTLGVALSGAVMTAIYAGSLTHLTDLKGASYGQFNQVMNNPLDPAKMRQALLACPNLSGYSVDIMLKQANETLAAAMSDIFRTYGVLLVLTILLNLFLAELPLRETSRLSSDR